MSQDQWSEVDRYFTDTLVKPDRVLESCLEASSTAGLPAINVSPPQGKLLHLLARIHGARSILEIGTLGGYSTIWLARALPAGGSLVTLESDPLHAAVAQSSIEQAGLTGVIELRIGLALDSLKQLAAEKRAPFDFVFIDADKPNNPAYFAWAMKLTRRGSVILVDNVVRKGEVVHPHSDDASVIGVRQMNQLIAAEPRVTATAIQTVGSKGYDGFLVALVTADA